MHAIPRLPASVFTLAALAACTMQSPAPKVDLAAERSKLMQTNRDWAQASAAKNADQIVSFLDDSATVMPPDRAPIVGKAALKEWVTQSLGIPKFSVTWEPQQATVASSGDFGYVIGQNTITFADASGKMFTQSGEVLAVWKKDATGAWKCVAEVWNNNPARLAQPAASTTAPK